MLPPWHGHLSGPDRLGVAGGALVEGQGRAPVCWSTGHNQERSGPAGS